MMDTSNKTLLFSRIKESINNLINLLMIRVYVKNEYMWNLLNSCEVNLNTFMSLIYSFFEFKVITIDVIIMTSRVYNPFLLVHFPITFTIHFAYIQTLCTYNFALTSYACLQWKNNASSHRVGFCRTLKGILFCILTISILSK